MSDITTLIIVVSVVGWLGLALGCAWMASKKGKDPLTWALIALLLGAIALDEFDEQKQKLLNEL